MHRADTYERSEAATIGIVHDDPDLGPFHPATKVAADVVDAAFVVPRHGTQHADLALDIGRVVIGRIEIDDLESYDVVCLVVTSLVDGTKGSLTNFVDASEDLGRKDVTWDAREVRQKEGFRRDGQGGRRGHGRR